MWDKACIYTSQEFGNYYSVPDGLVLLCWTILVSNERLISEEGWAEMWGTFYMQKFYRTALYIIQVISYTYKTFAKCHAVVHTLTYIYIQQYMYCLSCTVLCYLPHSLKGRGSPLFLILLILVFVLPVILLVYLVGCPSYLQSLVLTLLPCNFFFLGCAHVQLHRFLPLWWSHRSRMCVKHLHTVCGYTITELQNTVF